MVVAQHQVFQLCSCRIFAGHWASAVTPAGLEWVGIQNVGVKMADFDVSHTNYSPGLLPGLFEHVGFGIQLDSMRCVQMVAVGSCSLTSGGHGVPVVSSST